jgi:hypothetical protein
MKTFDKLQFLPNWKMYKKHNKFSNLDIVKEYLKDKHTLYREYREFSFEMKKIFYSWFLVLKLASFIIVPISLIVFYYGYTYVGIGLFLLGILNIILSKLSYRRVFQIEIFEEMFNINDMGNFFKTFEHLFEKEINEKTTKI